MSNFEIKGLAELEGKLASLGALGGLKVLARASRAAMKPALEDARRLCAKDTGALAASLRIATVKPSSGVVCASGLAFANKVKQEIPIAEGFEGPAQLVTRKGAGSRWHFVEFGVPSRGIPAKPFLRPAFEQNKEKILADLRESLERAVQRLIKKRERSSAVAG